jgi:hypothetical protein
VDLHTSHGQLVDPRNENEIWEHRFIGAIPKFAIVFAMKKTCISVIIKVSTFNKNFVPMTNHLFKDSK